MSGPQEVGVSPSDLILVFEGHDVSIFESPDAAVRFLEPIDVHGESFDVYRGDGSPGTLAVTTSIDPQQGVVKINFHSASDASRKELLHRIRSCLLALGMPRKPGSACLHSMIQELHTKVGITR